MARTTGIIPVSSASFARKDFSTPATVTVSHEFRSEHPWLRQQQRMSRGKTRGATECVHGLSTGYHLAVAALLGSRQTAGAPPRHRRQAASMRWSRKNKTAAPPEVCVAAATEGGVPTAPLRNLACVSLFLSRSVSPSVSLSYSPANLYKIQVDPAAKHI